MSSRLERSSVSEMEGKAMKGECMIRKAAYTLACVQIAIGLLLLGGTLYMATSLIPQVRDVFRQTSENLADAACAIRGANESYCEFTTNSLSMVEQMEDARRRVEGIGRQVDGWGKTLHSDKPVFNMVNDTGDMVRDLGKGVLIIAEVIRLVRDKVNRHYYYVHPQINKSLNDSAVMLQDVSVIMQGGTTTKVCWYIWLLGALVSLLFVMKGLVLFAVENKRLVGAAFVQR